MPTVNDNYPKKDNFEMTDAELKQLAIQNMQRDEVKSSGFPTEMVSLPSKGLVYPEGSPLRDGKVEMKYMTAREEDILTSQNLIKQGIVLDRLMQSMIVSPIKFDDLITGDKNALMIAARILGYGKDYEIDVTCPSCGEKTHTHVDLTLMPSYELPEDVTMVSPGVFEFMLPQSQRLIHFRLLTNGDDKRITKTLEVQKKQNKFNGGVDKELTTRLKSIIVSVDGNADPKYVSNFVDNELFAMDSRALRMYIKGVTPDQKFEVEFNCSHCGHDEGGVGFNVDTNFFWPKS